MVHVYFQSVDSVAETDCDDVQKAVENKPLKMEDIWRTANVINAILSSKDCKIITSAGETILDVAVTLDGKILGKTVMESVQNPMAIWIPLTGRKLFKIEQRAIFDRLPCLPEKEGVNDSCIRH